MGNQITKLPIDNIYLTPGNIIIRIEGTIDKRRAQAMERGEGMSVYCNLLHGIIVRVSNVNYGGGLIGNFRPGDEVWVRGGKGYPVKDIDGTCYFVFHEWDVAFNMTPHPL